MPRALRLGHNDGDIEAPGAALGVAWRRLPAPMPPFLRQAYALGCLLHRDRGDGGATRSPTFQIPVAPGAANDPTRFSRRVRPAIVSVRFPDGRAEAEAVFAARARVAIAREAQGHGLSSHLLTALSALPAPLGWKRGLVGARAPWLADAVDVIAGTGCLSYMRVTGATPLVAVSSPAQLLPPDARTSSSVLTVIADGEGATVTLAGSGRAASPSECEAFLEAWCADLAESALLSANRLGGSPASR
jgi:GNAT superfamily N-acetyltransferase